MNLDIPKLSRKKENTKTLQRTKTKTSQRTKQKSFCNYEWKKLIDCGKIRTITHNDLNKYLHHYSVKDLKKVKKSAFL